MNTKMVVDHLKKSVDWNRYVSLVHSLGEQFNDSQWRFLKAWIFENSLEVYSDGTVRYIGDLGCDLIVKTKNVGDTKVEMKFLNVSLFSSKRNKLRRNCNVTLMSSHGTNKYAKLPTSYADYLLIVTPNCAGLIDKKTLEKYVTLNGDGIRATIPTEKLHLIFSPEDCVGVKRYKIDLRKQIQTLIQHSISKIK